jgi:hypothetical protein
MIARSYIFVNDFGKNVLLPFLDLTLTCRYNKKVEIFLISIIFLNFVSYKLKASGDNV